MFFRCLSHRLEIVLIFPYNLLVFDNEHLTIILLHKFILILTIILKLLFKRLLQITHFLSALVEDKGMREKLNLLHIQYNVRERK